MKRILFTFISLGIVLGIACNETTGPDIQGVTPTERIYNVELSFNARDVTLFERQLTDDFTFYFNENDVGNDVNGYIIPESWNRDDISRAVDNLLELAHDVNLQLPEEDVGTPPEGATTYTADNIAVSLLVMVDENNGFIANKGMLEFTFENTPVSGIDQWSIIEWKDFTYAKKGVESTSFGDILAAFYPFEPTE